MIVSQSHLEVNPVPKGCVNGRGLLDKSNIFRIYIHSKPVRIKEEDPETIRKREHNGLFSCLVIGLYF